MPKIAYIEKRFHRDSLTIIANANELIESYQGDGFDAQEIDKQKKIQAVGRRKLRQVANNLALEE